MKTQSQTVRWLSIVVVSLLWAVPALAAEGAVQFNVNDTQGQPLPCRVHLLDSDGKPQKAVGQPFWNDHFVCSGRVAVDVAPGRYSWQIERGPEYKRASGSIEVVSDKTAIVNAKLTRIASLRQEGWYSGDLHVHRPASDVPLLMQAEDLDFAPVIDWWNARGGELAPVPETEATFDRHRVYQVRAGEDEREGGALLYFGLNSPLDLTAKSREFPSPMAFVKQARSQKDDVWIDIEKPFWWDVPTWLASGQMNSIGIANNHMCRSRMYESEAWGKPRDAKRLPSPIGNGYWTQEIYYHALNAGVRIPPSAGSASGVLPNPVGYNRVYVHLGDEKLDGDSWFGALAKGQCFVTNGPLLRVTANSEHAGTELKIAENGSLNVTLEIELTSNDPIREIEVIHNGRIIELGETTRRTGFQPVPSSGTRQVENLSYSHDEKLSIALEITEPGWFLVRAIADVDSTFRFASTAPWYVARRPDQVKRRSGNGAGASSLRSSIRPTAGSRISRASAQFFLDWVDERIDRVRENVSDPAELRAVLEPHENARVYWQNRVQAANVDLNEDDRQAVGETSARATALPSSSTVEAQPLLASIARLIEAMDYVGSPLPEHVVTELKNLTAADDAAFVTNRVQELLDPLCLAGVSLKEAGAPLVKPGKVKRELLEQGWRTFLVKVVNKPGLTRRLLIESPNAQPLPHSPADQVQSRWMQLSSYEGRPLKANLSGLELEYRIVQIYSRDPRRKQALLEFTVSNKAGDDGVLVHEWRFDKDTDGWHEMNQVQLTARDGSLHIT